MAQLAGSAVRRLRALRRRREHGELSDEDYQRAVSAELHEREPPRPDPGA